MAFLPTLPDTRNISDLVRKLRYIHEVIENIILPRKLTSPPVDSKVGFIGEKSILPDDVITKSYVRLYDGSGNLKWYKYIIRPANEAENIKDGAILYYDQYYEEWIPTNVSQIPASTAGRFILRNINNTPSWYSPYIFHLGSYNDISLYGDNSIQDISLRPTASYVSGSKIRIVALSPYGYTDILTAQSGNPPTGNLNTDVTIGGAYIYRVGGNDVAVTDGGTGLSSVSQGDILYANATNTLTTLPKVLESPRYLSNTGVNNNPKWSTIDLSSGGMTGVLQVANGGTGVSSITGIVTGNGANAFYGITTSAGISSVITDETGTGYLVFNTSPRFSVDISPNTSGGASLGTSSLLWSNLFLSTGGTIRFGNDTSISHSSGRITLSGDLMVDGEDIGITADSDLLGLSPNQLVVRGTILSPNIYTGIKIHANNPVTYDTVFTDFLAGYSGGTINRSIVVQQILDASSSNQYIFLNGNLGSSSTRASITCTSQHVQSTGLEGIDGKMNVITAPTGTNQSPTRLMTWDATTNRVGINNQSPSYTFDVIGTCRVTSNLTVGGDLIVDGADIGITVDTDLLGLSANQLTVRGQIFSPNTYTGTKIYLNNPVTYDTVFTDFLAGYSGSTSNRSIVIQQILDASSSNQYIFLNGNLGSSSTRASITCTSQYAPSMGVEGVDGKINVITAPSGTNQSPTRLMTWDATTNRVGINNQSPSYALDVTGEGRVTSNLVVGGNLDHDGDSVGFFGTTPSSKQTVSGSRGGNEALQSLLLALVAYGMIVDNTTS